VVNDIVAMQYAVYVYGVSLDTSRLDLVDVFIAFGQRVIYFDDVMRANGTVAVAPFCGAAFPHSHASPNRGYYCPISKGITTYIGAHFQSNVHTIYFSAFIFEHLPISRVPYL
jgi:hypothetical protein